MWKAELQLAEVTHQTGSKWLKLGHRINKKLFLYPEEALYLLETVGFQKKKKTETKNSINLFFIHFYQIYRALLKLVTMKSH